MSTTEDSSTVDRTKQAASNVAGGAGDRAKDVAATAKSEVRSVVDDARSQAATVVSTAQDSLRDHASEQAKTVSAKLGDFSQQLATMADSSDDPNANVAQLARSAADTLGRGARRLETGGLDGAFDDLKRLARNRPAAFLLGSVAAGFAIGRLVKHVDVRSALETAKQEVSSSGSDSPGELGTPSSGAGSWANESPGGTSADAFATTGASELPPPSPTIGATPSSYTADSPPTGAPR